MEKEKTPEQNFNYFCNKCKTPFDKLNSQLSCPFCQSSEITYNQKVKEAEEEKKKEKQPKQGFTDTLARFFVFIYLESLLNIKQERHTLPLLFLYFFVSYSLIKLFHIENLYALGLGLLFIIIRKR